MAVNNMTVEQAYSLIGSLHEQATGQKTVTPTDLSSFISVAQSTLAAGYDNVMAAISQVVGLTLVAVRPYTRKFAGLEVSTEQWGGIIRKLNFLDENPEENKQFALTDGSSIDQQVVNKPKVKQFNYVGSDVWTKHFTIFREQLQEAFSSPTALGSFMTGVMTHFSNLREQYLEEMSRSCLCNFIAGKNYLNNGVIHLLTEYNTAIGASPAYTATTIKDPSVYPAFVKWCYGRIANLTQMMTERSEMFQAPITGAHIVRHTPLEMQRVYMASEFLNEMTARVLADTYHDDFLIYSDVEAVNYWQAIDSPLSIQVTPVVIDGDGDVATGTAQSMSDVLGVIFDRDAVGYNIYWDEMMNSPYNARGSYYNIWNNIKIQYQNDFTEKGLVLILD